MPARGCFASYFRENLVSMSKQCLFCDNAVNSKEHVWPRWLIRLLNAAEESRPMSLRRHDGTVANWLAKNSPLQFKEVCIQCNNEWMSDLENAAIPVMTPLIRGKAMTLNTGQQTTIGAWATKCAMLFDAHDAGDVFYDRLDRLHFRRSLTPPLNSTGIWLGRYNTTGSSRAFTEHRTLRTPLQRSGHPVKSHVHTMAFGFLVLQIVSIKRTVHERGAIRINFQHAVNLPWDKLTVEVWPNALHLKPARWPPSLSFDDSIYHLQLLANRFGGSET